MKTIIVACGTGIATSTVVVSKVKELLEENQIEANFIQCTAAEISNHVDQADLIITTMQMENPYAKPIVVGMSFLTGIGVDETKKEILEHLQS